MAFGFCAATSSITFSMPSWLGYGACGQSLASGETGDTLLKSNSSVIGGAYYTLGGVVTLATEWTHTISKNQIGDSLGDNSLAIGASTGF